MVSGIRVIGRLTVSLFAGFVWAAPADAQDTPPQAVGPVIVDFVDSPANHPYYHFVMTPPHAERCQESGAAVFDVKIDPNGIVSSVSMIKSSSVPELDVAARQSVLGWRYPPSKNARHRKEKVAFGAPGPRVWTGDCSAEATKAYADALEQAPMVIPIRMPKGMSSPRRLSSPERTVDFDPANGKACAEDAYTLTMSVVLAADGRVRKIEPWESSGAAALDRDAYDLIKSLRFRPAKRGGEPVPVTIGLFVTPRPAGAKCHLLVE